MLTITIDDKATPALERMDKAAPGVVRPLNRKRGERWQTGMQAATPLGRGRNPGKTIAAWDLDDQVDAQRLHNDAKHLPIVIKGRGPIVAKGKALHFWIDGQEFFRKRVGPAAPNDFISRTIPKLQAGDQADADGMARAIVAELK